MLNPLLHFDHPILTLTGRRALVTGSGRGIGRAVALALARQGADVALAARSRDELERVAEEIRRLGREAWVLPGALNDWDQAEELVRRAEEAMGAIHILVNNAGGGSSVPGGIGPLREATREAFDSLYGLNLRAPFAAAKAAANGMIERGHPGAIVNVASIDGLSPAPGEAVYGSAKAALISLTEAMAIEYGAHDIRANAVAPSLIDTELVSRHLRTPEDYQARASFFPLNRIGKPEDVAAAVLFLCSDEASWISGVTIKVAGGQQATSDLFRWVRSVNPVPPSALM